MSNRRYRLILHTVLETGDWTGRMKGARVRFEKVPSLISGHAIHWHTMKNREAHGGIAETVKDAIEFCERRINVA